MVRLVILLLLCAGTFTAAAQKTVEHRTTIFTVPADFINRIEVDKVDALIYKKATSGELDVYKTEKLDNAYTPAAVKRLGKTAGGPFDPQAHVETYNVAMEWTADLRKSRYEVDLTAMAFRVVNSAGDHEPLFWIRLEDLEKFISRRDMWYLRNHIWQTFKDDLYVKAEHSFSLNTSSFMVNFLKLKNVDAKQVNKRIYNDAVTGKVDVYIDEDLRERLTPDELKEMGAVKVSGEEFQGGDDEDTRDVEYTVAFDPADIDHHYFAHDWQLDIDDDHLEMNLKAMSLGYRPMKDYYDDTPEELFWLAVEDWTDYVSRRELLIFEAFLFNKFMSDLQTKAKYIVK